jgi:putative membrane protein
MKNEKKLKQFAIIISIVLPLAVAILFGVKIDGVDLSFLPTIYATINGATAIVLILAYIAIKQKKKKLHQDLINTAVVLSVSFLLMYVAYHATSDSTIFGDINSNGILEDSESAKLGAMTYIYYFILISHILLSIIITPFVCFTYLKGWLGDYEGHKKITRITFPLWMYVAVTGVIVYTMISPYYA